MAFNLGQRIRVSSKHANIDERYGPFNSITEALNANSLASREKGRTVYIEEEGKVVEYWFEAGTADSDLVRKTGGDSVGDVKPMFIEVTMLDIGASESETEDNIKQKLSDWIEAQGFEIPAGEIWFFELEREGSDEGGGSDGGLTLEQARQNGNVLEGDVEFNGLVDGVIKSNSESNKEIRFWGDESYINIRNTDPLTGNNSAFSSTISTVELRVQAIDENILHGVKNTYLTVENGKIRVGEEYVEDFKGIIGNREFNKQGDRLAFAQLGDVYDANSYSTNEIKTGGTWIDGRPIYRKIVEMNGSDIYNGDSSGVVITFYFQDADVFVNTPFVKIDTITNSTGIFYNSLPNGIPLFLTDVDEGGRTIRIGSSALFNYSTINSILISLEYVK